MPQSGTGVSVEAVDEVFQQKMIDLLKLTGLNSVVVGWYHSHPGLCIRFLRRQKFSYSMFLSFHIRTTGFGPWLSGIDQRTQSV